MSWRKPNDTRADPKLLDALSRASSLERPEPAGAPAVPLPQRGDFPCGEKVALEDLRAPIDTGIVLAESRMLPRHGVMKFLQVPGKKVVLQAVL